MDNKIQFTAKDIVNKYYRLLELDSNAREKNLEFGGHELRGEHGRLDGFLGLLIQENDENGLNNTHQRAYISNVSQTSAILNQSRYNVAGSIKQIAKLLEIKKSEEHSPMVNRYIEAMLGQNDMDIAEDATRIIKNFQTLSQYTPITEAIINSGKVSDDQKFYLEIADFQIGKLVYKYNRQFAPNFKRDECSLDSDVKAYYAEQFVHKNPMGIKMLEPVMPNIITKFDYFNDVIIPVIDNIFDHGYNPDNDIHKRLESKDFVKEFRIEGVDNKAQQNILVSIEDNGFGIRPKFEKKMFTEGGTSRKNADGHGKGLWLIKDSVEREQHGKMWYDTKLGEGTTFHFTIPYKMEKHGLVYVQNTEF